MRILKFLEGETIAAGAPFTVRTVDDRPSAGRARQTWSGVAPVGDDPARGTGWDEIELPPGHYEVEVVLPSGEILIERVALEDGDQRTLLLESEAPASAGRSWAQFGGSRPVSLVEKGEGLVRSKQWNAGPLDPIISLGDQLRDGRASSWTVWHAWLARRAASVVEGMQLEAAGLSGEASLTADVLPATADRTTSVRVRSIRPWERGRPFPRARQFISVQSHAGERVCIVPWPWPMRAPGQRPFFELNVAERDGRLATEPVLRDAEFGGLFAYLNAGRVARAGQLLPAARQALHEKFVNPLGAAAGGYVLLSTAEDIDADLWPVWLRNLARRFPEIPDGAILRARWLLGEGGRKNRWEAEELLLEAFDRGLPYFAAGVVWLIEGLRQLSVRSPECANRLKIVQGVARSMDLSQAFTCLDIPRPNAREGDFARRLRSLSPAEEVRP